MKLAQAAPRHQFVLLPTRRLALAMAIRVIPIGSRTRSGIGMTSMVSRASAPLPSFEIAEIRSLQIGALTDPILRRRVSNKCSTGGQIAALTIRFLESGGLHAPVHRGRDSRQS
jgi:hypothetical protein